MARRTAPGVGPTLDVRGTHFVLGKGGSGKSLVAEGLALLAARDGERVLLVRLGESASVDRESAAMTLRHGFEVIDLDARDAMDDYVRRVVRIRPLAARIIASDVYRRFFAAAPGLPELVLLGRIRAYAEEAGRRGESRWSVVIVDCPSSGHGVLMLETPSVALRAVTAGPFSRVASGVAGWLKEATSASIVAVPEEMAVVEAIELGDELRERVGLRPRFVFLNRMRGETLSVEARRVIASAASAGDELLAESARRAAKRSRLEGFHRRRLAKGLGVSPIGLVDMGDADPESMEATIREATS